MQLIKAGSPGELGDILGQAGIDTSSWSGEYKSLEELHQEVEHGDCFLVQDQSGQIFRRVRVVAVILDYDYQVLVEDTQTHNQTGEIRHRKIAGSLIEKLMLDESPEEGALRLLDEEMGLKVRSRNLGTFEQGMKNMHCPSYPGLQGEYHIYRTHVQMPVEMYQSSYQEDFDPWTTSWKWVPADQANQFFEQI